MTPFHPKLRKALLRDPAHKRAGLTANLLLDYEGLVTRYFNAEHYQQQLLPVDGQLPPDRTHEIKQGLVAEILTFRRDFMPRFDEITREFVDNQERVVNNNYHDLNVGKIIGDSFTVLWLWLLAVLFNRRKRSDFETGRLRTPRTHTHKPDEIQNHDRFGEEDEETGGDKNNHDRDDKHNDGKDYKNPI